MNESAVVDVFHRTPLQRTTWNPQTYWVVEENRLPRVNSQVLCEFVGEVFLDSPTRPMGTARTMPIKPGVLDWESMGRQSAVPWSSCLGIESLRAGKKRTVDWGHEFTGGVGSDHELDLSSWSVSLTRLPGWTETLVDPRGPEASSGVVWGLE